MLKFVALFIASLAIAANGVTFKPFINGMEKRGEPVITKNFIGVKWKCGDERCFSGLKKNQGLVTGP